MGERIIAFITFYMALFLINNLKCQSDGSYKVSEYPIRKDLIQSYPPEVWEDICNEIQILLKDSSYLNDERYVFLPTPMILFNTIGLIPLDSSYCRKQLNKSLILESEGYDFRPSTTILLEQFRTLSFEETENLPDGDYVFYYEPFYDRETDSWINDRAFGHFTISQRYLNGQSLFYSPYGDTIASGNYLNGRRESTWHYKIPIDTITDVLGLYSPVSNVFCEYEIDFHNGLMNGNYEFKVNNVLRAKGEMLNDKLIGFWQIFHKNGMLSNSLFLVENPIELSVKKKYRFVDTKTGSLPFGTKAMIIPGLNTKLESESFQLIMFTSPGTAEIYLDKEFKAYYESGQLMYHMVIDKGNVVSGDTLFHPNGLPLYVWDFSTSKKRGKFYIYDETGILLYEERIKRGDI
ncbi:MAG: hypothetical protein HYZ14_04825 [Bacteroidetes bacterium]|nr:hypothetical protein [Bacteroidota bacterium]